MRFTSILSRLIEESDLPSETDVRACLGVDLDSLIVSDAKLQDLRDEFSSHLDRLAEPAAFEEHLGSVRSFMLVVVEEILAAKGMREEVTYHLSVGCPLSCCVSSLLLCVRPCCAIE